MRKFLRSIWQVVCALIAAAIGAVLLGLWMESWTLAAVGIVAGLPVGWLFGRLSSPLDMLADLD